MTRVEIGRFRKLLTDFVRSIQPLTGDGGELNSVYLDTRAGKLRINQFGAVVYCRFDDPIAAYQILVRSNQEEDRRLHLPNPTSGKWHFSFGRESAEAALDRFLQHLRPLLHAPIDPAIGLLLSLRGTRFSTMGVSFRDGKKYLDGHEVARTRYIYECRSTSNRDTIYVAIQYTDGSTSCNCAGWWSAQSRLRQGKGDGHCKHSRVAARLTEDVRLRPAATPVPTPIPQPAPAPPTAYCRRMLPRTKLDD